MDNSQIEPIVDKSMLSYWFPRKFGYENSTAVKRYQAL